MERAQLELVRGLLDRGHHIHVVARVCEIPAHPRLRWTRIFTPRRPFALAFPAFALAAAAAVRSDRADVRTTLGALAPVAADVSIVQFCHHGFAMGQPLRRRRRAGTTGALHDTFARWLALAMESLCYRRSRVRGFLPVSDRLAHELQRHFPQVPVLGVIANGVDTHRFRPDIAARKRLRRLLGIGADDLVALFVGGDWARKGLPVAIAGAARAADWRLVVVGSGDGEEAKAEAAKAGARIDILAPTPEIAPYFAMADAFVLPSAYEGFALVTLEAASSGLPLVVTEACGAGALIEAGAGEVVEADPDSVAGALDRLVPSSARRQAGRRARAAAEPFAWERIIEQHERIYRELCSPGTGPLP